jgi:hypothetical protein
MCASNHGGEPVRLPGGRVRARRADILPRCAIRQPIRRQAGPGNNAEVTRVKKRNCVKGGGLPQYSLKLGAPESADILADRLHQIPEEDFLATVVNGNFNKHAAPPALQ